MALGIGVRGGALACGCLLALTGCAGEPRVLTPRTPPPHELPHIPWPSTAVPEDSARIALETTDGPMRVTAQYDPSFVPPGGAVTTARSGELCTTPCIVELPRGRYRLFLSAFETGDAGSGDTDDLVVEHGTYVYRRAPGRYETPSMYDRILPGMAVLTSIVGFVIGAAIVGQKDQQVPGYILLGAGAVGGVASGIWLYDSSRAVRQDGATSLWQVQR